MEEKIEIQGGKWMVVGFDAEYENLRKNLRN